MLINPQRSTLEEILNANQQYVIPEYQRGYKWGTDQALELINDLESYAGDSKQLFLGTLIFNVSQSAKNTVSIIDGQQRLTTIMFLLIACREHAEKIGASGIAHKVQDKITFTDSATAKSIGPRLESSAGIRALFDYMASSDWQGDFPDKLKISGKTRALKKRSANQIKSIYNFFAERIKNYDIQSLSAFLKSLYSSYVIKIEIVDDIEALSIFERTNARGLDLEVADLLKNFLFMKKVPNLEERWDTITENADGNLLRLLKYFYAANRQSVRKSELYSKIREWGHQNVEELIDKLCDFSNYYKFMRTPITTIGVREYFKGKELLEIESHERRYETIRLAIEGLQLFGIVQYYPVIYSAIEAAARTNHDTYRQKNADKLVDLFRTLEKYHFINNAICTRIGNEVEDLYARYSAEFVKTDNFISTVDALIYELAKKLAARDEFISNFIEQKLDRSSISIIWYIFDRIANKGRDAGQFLSLYQPDPSIQRRNHNIEHFYPQANSEIGDDILHNIGNLLPLYYKDNSRLGNGSPQEKMSKLRGALSGSIENNVYVKNFIEKYGQEAENWGLSNIRKRAEELAEEAYDEVWSIKISDRQKAN